MRFEHSAAIAASRARVWDLLMDVPRSARLVPGVESVEAAGPDRYRGTLRVQVGPVRLALEGDVAITARDAEAGTATMRVDAADARAGGAVRATLGLALSERDGATELRITTDAQVLGRIGEFGQPIIKRKADQLMSEFAANVQAEATR